MPERSAGLRSSSRWRHGTWFRPPDVAGRALAARASLLHSISWIAIIASGSAAIVFPFFFGRWVEAIVVNAIVALLSMGVLAVLMRGAVDLAARLFSFVAVIAVIMSVVNSGGISSPGVLIMPTSILIAGFLGGPRGAIAGSVALILALVGIGLAQRAGIIVPPENGFTAAETWLSFTTSLIATGSVVYASVDALGRALRDAEKSESRLAELVEQSPDGILATSPQGTILHANAAAYEMFPARSELVGVSVTELPGLDESGRESLRRRVEGVDRDEGNDLTLVVHDENIDRSLRVRLARVVADSNASRIQLTLRDETERARAERERRRLEAELVQSQKLQVVGQLAGGVAHDFNNYLTIIRTCSDAIRSKAPADDRQSQLLHAIGEAADRAADLTRQLLALSRKHVLQPRPFDLVELVRSNEQMLKHAIGPKIDLQIDCDQELVPVFADPSQIEVALLNLVVNARDAMSGGGTLTIEVGVAHVDEEQARRNPGLRVGAYALLGVIDEGVGMDAATLARAREPFFSTKGSRGTGLGLSTVDAIVQQVDGVIEIESVVGKGTRASIFLGLADRADPITSRIHLEVHEVGSERVWLVEDQPALRSVTESILMQHGYTVVSFDTAERALAALGNGSPPDLLFSDVLLPGIDGFDLVARIRAVHPSIPVLLVSGFTDVGERRNTPLDVRFLAKPYTASRLLRELRAAITGQPSRAIR